MQELAVLQTYTEISPSGTGIKQIVKGRLPEGKATKPGSQTEMYDGKPGRERYFAITGLHLSGTPTDVVVLGEPLTQAYRRMMAFDLAEAFKRRGMLRERKEGKRIVRCPWADQHTHSDDEAALLKKRGRKGGYAFKCLHAHCTTRTVADVFTFFGYVHHDCTDTDNSWHHSALGRGSDSPALRGHGRHFRRATQIRLRTSRQGGAHGTFSLASVETRRLYPLLMGAHAGIGFAYG